MAAAVYGATSRRPVYSGSRRVPGLYERTLAGGQTVYDVALRLGGAVRRHRLEASTKTDAINDLRALQVDYERGERHRSAAAALTLGELAADWLVHLRSRVGDRGPRRRYSARTVELYEQRLRTHIIPALGSLPAAEITVADVRRLVDRLCARALAPATVTGVTYVLSGLLRFGVKSGHVERNPVRDLDRDDKPGTKRQSEPRYLDADQLELLLGELSDAFRPVVATCMFTGLRISEALGLRWRDVDFKAGTLTVAGQLGAEQELVATKTPASAATVELLPALVRELRAHRRRQAGRDLRRMYASALVFTTARGKPQDRHNALRALKKAGDKAGLNGGREPVGLHDLRHSFVALALANGANPSEAAQAARHANANVNVTLTMYAGLTEQGRGAAARKLLNAGFGA